MNPVEAVVVFVLIWWLVLFCVLPWGVSRVAAPEAGHDPGAPERPRVLLKLGVTTGISAALFGIVFWVVRAEIFSLRDMLGVG